MPARMKPLKKGAKSWNVVIRLPVEFRGPVEQHLNAMKGASPGASVSHSDAIRNLIALGLASARMIAE